MQMKIGERVINQEAPPYLIAEMSANHGGSIDAAFRILQGAKNAGADAVKIQTYSPDTITLDCDDADFQITEGLWKGTSLYELYQKAYTPWEWHAPLFQRAKELGITLFSSPFDSTAVDLLENLNAPAYKIASFEAIDLPLISYVASTKKPMIISTGMANLDEIAEAVEIARDFGCTELALLHCVSAYPAAPASYNLTTISDLSSRFGLLTGLSDHTLGNATAIAASVLNASIIEKHVTLDKKGGGPDDSFSIDLEQLASLALDCKTAWSAKGQPSYDRQVSEEGNVKFRRSLYFCRDLSKGSILTEQDIKSIRPGYGLPPKHFYDVIGKKLTADITLGTRVTWDFLSD